MSSGRKPWLGDAGGYFCEFVNETDGGYEHAYLFHALDYLEPINFGDNDEAKFDLRSQLAIIENARRLAGSLSIVHSRS